jgi:hypothetical protein
MPAYKLILLASLLGFCAFSLCVKENYPFSHYPMYSDPDPTAFYHYLTDGEGKPLATYAYTGKSAAQVGKIIRTRSLEHAKMLGMEAKKMPPAEWDAVCRDTLAYLHAQSQSNGTPLPAKVRIMRTDIRFEKDQVMETPRVLFAE